ncbi:hypothetical protein AAW12_08740 [Sphingobacterium sp. Ag1]|uniref:hypothetical protein n=1 Tax=Sphingobacterium sp. Ag1 TaxID=1643451 RepID=UPI000627A5A8|nr:hypothetical protein [Sphingobacterium sp. Ag1]KKO91739.1 hypothetical protein AAW12_08740 [Sphingobacterium sp. Ag1]
MAELGEGTKDVSQAEVRTDMSINDKLLLVNETTKEVQQVDLDVLGNTIAPHSMVAPAEYGDFFGL